MNVRSTGKRVCDRIVTKILFDQRGIAVRGIDGTPVIASEEYYTFTGRRTLALNCHSTDVAITDVALEVLDEPANTY
jgi:hypothetical protein